jgi:hypothetical protein
MSLSTLMHGGPRAFGYRVWTVRYTVPGDPSSARLVPPETADHPTQNEPIQSATPPTARHTCNGPRAFRAGCRCGWYYCTSPGFLDQMFLQKARQNARLEQAMREASNPSFRLSEYYAAAQTTVTALGPVGYELCDPLPLSELAKPVDEYIEYCNAFRTDRIKITSITLQPWVADAAPAFRAVYRVPVSVR